MDTLESDYIISKDLDLCEGCGKWTHVIIVEKQYYKLRIKRIILRVIAILFFSISLLMVYMFLIKHKC